MEAVFVVIGVVAGGGDYHVVYYVDVEQGGGGNYAAGEFVVLHGGAQLAGGVVVDQRYGRCLGVNHAFEQQLDVDHRGGHAALAHKPFAVDAVGAVEHKHPKFLVGQALEAGAHVVVDGLAGGDLRAVVDFGQLALAAGTKLYGGHQGDGFDRPYAGHHAAELLRCESAEGGEVVAAHGQNFTAHLKHRFAHYAGAQLYGYEFGRSEGAQAVAHGFFAWLVVVGKHAQRVRVAHFCLCVFLFPAARRVRGAE